MLTLEELRVIRSKRKLTIEEKLAYREHWQSSRQSQRLFCQQEDILLSTFRSWIKSSLSISKDKARFIPVELSLPPKCAGMPLQIKFPDGLVIEGYFSLSEVGHWLKEFRDGFAPLC